LIEVIERNNVELGLNSTLIFEIVSFFNFGLSNIREIENLLSLFIDLNLEILFQGLGVSLNTIHFYFKYNLI